MVPLRNLLFVDFWATFRSDFSRALKQSMNNPCLINLSCWKESKSTRDNCLFCKERMLRILWRLQIIKFPRCLVVWWLLLSRCCSKQTFILGLWIFGTETSCSISPSLSVEMKCYLVWKCWLQGESLLRDSFLLKSVLQVKQLLVCV